MIAIIPARGGSRGLPGKNIRPLAGKPLIAHTIGQALAAPSISRVLVSTDSPEIAQVAQQWGAEVPFLRPDELAQDHSLAIDTYLHTLRRLEQAEGFLHPELVVLQPTSPLRAVQDIEDCVALFRQRQADSVLTYYEANVPPAWAKRLDEQGKPHNYFAEALENKNRQEAATAYLPNGAVFVFRFELLERQRLYITDRSYAHVMPYERSIDIDSAIDFELAEFFLARRGH